MTTKADFLLIGAGIIGITLALELRRRQPGARIVVIEKEVQPGQHASGRNSGVLHAGFYYSADSLKARFCRDGNRELAQYCRDRALALNACGKLVVARNERELPQLEELLRRGRANGVDVQCIDAADVKPIEPRARTCERALWSPTTASVDPQQVMATLTGDAESAGVQILRATSYLGKCPDGVLTSAGRITAGYVINAAGLHAARIAHDYGFAAHFDILPFKGLYLCSSEPAGSLRTNVYPVPDLQSPFLGVHFTVTVDGHVKIGPTAIPACWQEQYRGFERFRWRELVRIAALQLRLLSAHRFYLARLAASEFPKYWRRHLVARAATLVENVHPRDFRRWGQPGLRAQLVNLRTRTLEMDFRFEGDGKSFHVLNAISPAFTCSFPFSRFLADEIERLSR